MKWLCSDDDDPDPAPTALVIVAHPGDEIFGAAGRLSRLGEAMFLHVADGGPLGVQEVRAAGFLTRRSYARACQEQVASALSLAGIRADQIYGLEMLEEEVSLELVGLSRLLVQLFSDLGPEVVLTHAFEGRHADHDAVAFAVHSASRLLRESGAHPPVILELTADHGHAESCGGADFLPCLGYEATTIVLSPSERRRKAQMIERLWTQRGRCGRAALVAERFRLAPRYDFRMAATAGMTGAGYTGGSPAWESWREAAHRALEALGLGGGARGRTVAGGQGSHVAGVVF